MWRVAFHAIRISVRDPIELWVLASSTPRPVRVSAHDKIFEPRGKCGDDPRQTTLPGLARGDFDMAFHAQRTRLQMGWPLAQFSRLPVFLPRCSVVLARKESNRSLNSA